MAEKQTKFIFVTGGVVSGLGKQEQLQYVLSNLDVENMSDEMRTKLQNL